MHAAVVAGPASRLIVETAVHRAAGGEGCVNAVGVIGIIVVLGIQNSNEGSSPRGSNRRNRGIRIPVVLNEANDTARVRKRIADRGRIVGQARERIFFHRQVMRA